MSIIVLRQATLQSRSATPIELLKKLAKQTRQIHYMRPLQYKRNKLIILLKLLYLYNCMLDKSIS